MSRTKDVEIEVGSRSDVFRFYAIGDVHVGEKGCMENKLKTLVKMIELDDNAYWFDGGDSIEALARADIRTDPAVLPDWFLEGTPEEIRERQIDPVTAQVMRYCEIVEPIKSRCIGKIEGNHEFVARKRYDKNAQKLICDYLDIDDLTDRGVLRLIFRRKFAGGTSARTVNLDILHGNGGGRTPGAEPNHLFRLMLSSMSDIVLRGHSHTFHIAPPRVMLGLSKDSKLTSELIKKEQYAANWGCWVACYRSGYSSYHSRANYPPHPFRALEVSIQPHHNPEPIIEMRGINL